MKRKVYKKRKVRKEKLNNSLRFPIRILGSSTSLSIRRSVVALWLTLTTEDDVKTPYKDIISDFIYTCINSWEGQSAKGLSEYVAERMLQDILEKEDYKRYQKISLGI